MKISIIGLGWFGTPLAHSLKAKGHSILGTTRSQNKRHDLMSSGIKAHLLDYPDKPNNELLSSDLVILNIPPFPEELNWLKSWTWDPQTWIIFISSTSQKKILLEQENWVQSYFKKWTILRFAGLIGEDRHPGKYLSGKENLPGRLWPVNLIHQEDCVAFTELVIEKKIIKDCLNVVSSEHPIRENYYTDYCKKNELLLPLFDQADHSEKAIVSSEKMNQYYVTHKI